MGPTSLPPKRDPIAVICDGYDFSDYPDENNQESDAIHPTQEERDQKLCYAGSRATGIKVVNAKCTEEYP